VKKRKFLYPLFSFCLVALNAKATIILPKVLGDNMVLQRNAPVAIWGWADKDEKITVKFAGQQKNVMTDVEGKWMIRLDAMAASNKPKELTISGSNTIVLKNILVGEVWLCSGQSNMEYTMMKESKFAHALRGTGLDSAALKSERNPFIRLFLVKRDLTKGDAANVNKGWNEAEGESLRAFSAAGYFFAKKLYEELHIPIGMIGSSVSGSNIEPWMSGEIKNGNNPQTISIDESAPGKFYLGMIKPLAPFTLKGFLWYQGETNCFLKESPVYGFKFKHLINSWRTLWNEKDAPFYFVQIAPFEYSKNSGKVVLTDTDLPAFRQAQAEVLSLPHTGMVVTTDLVDHVSDLHPTYKWEIGKRLALLALAHDYGKKIEYTGPVLKEVQAKGNSAELSFDHVGVGIVSNNNEPLTWFEIAGHDGVYHPANATIAQGKIIVTSAAVSSPASVRFGWHEAAQPNFFNKDGLPAVPFNININKATVAKNKKD
jgi:sialate O-acetylesterase